MATYITKRAKELGIKQVDAERPMIIEVHPGDVSKSVQKDPKRCAFSRACRRADKRIKEAIKEAFFFRTTAWLEYKDKMVRYILPPSMQKEIVSFDRHRTMDIGVYQLSKPQKSHTLSSVHSRSKKRPGRHPPGNGTIKRKVHRHFTTSIREAGR